MIATQNCTIKQFPKVYQNLSNNQVKQQWTEENLLLDPCKVIGRHAIHLFLSKSNHLWIHHSVKHSWIRGRFIGKVLNLIVCSMLDSFVLNYFLFKCFRIRNTDERQNWKSKYKLAIQYLFILLLFLCDAVISVQFRWCCNCVPVYLGFFYFTINVRINVHKLICGFI